MNYTIYNIATGEILRIVICDNPDEQISNGQAYLEGSFSDIEYTISNGQPIAKPNPVFDADAAALKIRIKRNKLLVACDWTQLPDSSVNKSTWASYRQELRDITAQQTFPENVAWPIAPN